MKKLRFLALTIWLLLNLTLGLFFTINQFGLSRVNAQTEDPPPTYTLTVNIVGSGSVTLEPAGGSYAPDTLVRLDATADPGWTFDSWSDDLTGSTNPETLIMNDNATVTATFIQDEYTLTVNVVGSGSVDLNVTGPYLYGDVVELTAIPVDGWEFAGWNDDLSGTTNPETMTMDSDKTVTATFTEIPPQYTLTVNIVGSGDVTVKPYQETYLNGTEVELTAVETDSNWEFTGWSGDLGGDVTPQNITMDADKSVTATFTENSPKIYNLTIDVSGSGSTEPLEGTHTYTKGTEVEVNSTADSGWMLENWIFDGLNVGNETSYTVTMDSNHSLTAVFTKIPRRKHVLTIIVSGSGSTEPPAGTHTIEDGTDVKVNATAESGWMFDHWILDTVDVGTANPYTVTMNADHSLTAVFIDITPPTIEITSPQNIVYSTNSINLNFTVNEETFWIGYSLDGADNVTISENTPLTGLSDGTHNVRVYANDTAGNMGESTLIYFSVDTTPPTITILSPVSSTYSSSVISLTFSVSEETSWIGYTLDEQNNITISGNTTISIASEGAHKIVVYANDTVGNMGKSAEIYFTVYFPSIDTTPPTITITSPQEKTYSTSEVDLTFTINEPVSWRAYSLDGEDNVTINGNTVLSGLSDGEHKIKIFARDNAGNTGVSNIVTFLVDTTPPIISLNSPEETTYSTTNVFLDFTLNEEVTWIGYSLDEQDNVTITADLMLSGLSEGSHSIVVFATDSAGNTGASDLVQFTISIPPVDTTPPIIVITSPESTTYEVSDVPLDFTVNEVTSWIGYSLDGQDNVTITGNIVLSGLSEGSHSIVVFATDSAGNTGASDLVQFAISIPPVDTTPPIIVVTSPENTTYNTNKISLTFTVNEEPSLKSYSLDGKANVTVVDSIVLSNLSDGEHRLIMYAKDSTGNIGASKVIIFTIATENEELTQLWIVGVIGLVAFVGFMFSAYIAYDLFKSPRTEI